MKGIAACLTGLVIAAAQGGCAHYQVNPPLSTFDPKAGYRLDNVPASAANSDELFVVLAIGGGGKRSAALAYGVMQQLHETWITVGGRRRCLLDEVDMISADSGGAFPAAYYALFGDELFVSFEKEFLKRDIEGDLILELLAPWNSLRMISPTFDRGDVVMEYFDRTLLGGKTYGDLLERRRRPFLIINATDMTFMAPFSFTQDTFDLWYSDLSGVPVAQAVTTSVAVPALLTPATFRNHAHRPGFKVPGWVAEAIKDRQSPRRARQLRSYLKPSKHPYIHGVDPGVVDNTGTSPVLQALRTKGCPWSIARKMHAGRIKRLLVITVNARIAPDRCWDQRRTRPGALETLSLALDASIYNSMSGWIARLRHEMDRLADQLAVAHRDGPADPAANAAGPPARRCYLVEVAFDRIDDEETRRFCNNAPTRLSLPDKTVDHLIGIGARLLRESKDLRELVSALNDTVEAEARAAKAGGGGGLNGF